MTPSSSAPTGSCSVDAAIAERDAQALQVEEAEAAKDRLDSLDAQSWQAAEVAAARSELDRCSQAVATLYRACADRAEALARVPVEQAEAELAAVDGNLADLTAQVSKVRAEREQVEDRLTDARAELVQHWLGHADSRTTSRYLHYRSRVDEARVLSEAFRIEEPETAKTETTAG